MQPITKEELLDYFSSSICTERPDGWGDIKKAVDSDITEKIEPLILYLLMMGAIGDPRQIIQSAIFTGFQMGRHFEQRKAEIAELNSLCQNKP